MHGTFTVGRFRVHRVPEWEGAFAPPAALFSPFDDATFNAHAPAFSPDYLRDGVIYAALQSWVIETPTERLIFDTGAGNLRVRPGFPFFGGLQTDFLDTLHKVCGPPSTIDTVICSHLHIDHVGWNTVQSGTDWVPTFPNARYLFPATEVAAWDPSGPIYPTLKGAAVNQGVFEDSVQPILRHNRAHLVTDGFEILPGATLRDAPGHSPGQMVLHLRDQGDEALFTADVFHHPMEMIRPDWNSAFCEDPEAARATRKRLIGYAAGRNVRIVPAHFAGARTMFLEPDGWPRGLARPSAQTG